MTAKLITMVVILALVLAYTLQNTEAVQIAFYPWKAEVSKALLTLGTFFVGVIIGFILGKIDKRRGRKEKELKEVK